MDALIRFINTVGMILVIVFVALIFAGFMIGETEMMSEIYKKIGTIAEIGAITAASLWLARLLIREMKARGFSFYKYIQSAFKLLREHHTLIGWAAFSAALAHGSYFFLQTNEEKGSIYSGLFTLIGFAILVLFGFILDRISGKKRQKFKKLHQGLAILFGAALGIHLLFG